MGFADTWTGGKVGDIRRHGVHRSTHLHETKNISFYREVESWANTD